MIAQRIMATRAFSLCLVPGGIRVIGGHRLCKLCCVGTKVLFVNRSRFVDNKSHHTRGAVLDRVGDEGESCAHLPIDDIVLGAARRMSPLASEDPKHIPIERNMLANLVGWENLARKILLLRVDQLAAVVHGGNFILADAPEEDLVFSCWRVEIPPTVVIHQWNRTGPVFGSDYQGYCPVRLCDEPMHLLVFDDEADARIQIFLWVAGREDILSGWSEDAQWSLFVLCLHCAKECATGIFGGGKGSLSRLLSEHWCRRTSQGKCEQNRYCKSNNALAFKLSKKRNPAQHGVLLHF